MELVNKTPVLARVAVGQTADPGLRRGCVTAKATYCIGDSGELTPDLEHPVPLLDEDLETPLGLLPRDDLPRGDDAFEVICLGAAHAPGARAVEQMTASLQVGHRQQTLLVSGDRSWQGSGDTQQPSAAVPFLRMPLTWERAFGGTAVVTLDAHTELDVSHPLNPEGRGFDPTPQAAAMGQLLRAPAGYPRVDDRRSLPNVEHPEQAITAAGDAPDPACWATVPMSSATQALRGMTLPTAGASATDLPGLPDVTLAAFHRAVPQWIIELPEPRADVVLRGLSPDGTLEFTLPAADLWCDVALGPLKASRRLRPQLLVLLPERRRFYLVYRHRFTLQHQAGQQRCMRLRLERGWYVQGDS